MAHQFDNTRKSGRFGCVAWSFDKRGVLVIDNEDGDYEEEPVMMDAMDAAGTTRAEEDCFTVLHGPDDFTPWLTP